MLNKIRTRHAKKILWILSIIIIISFTLWGGASFVQKRNAPALGKINGVDVSAIDFNYYYKMAQIRFLLFMPADKQEKITHTEINSQAWQYLLLVSKVKKDNISVDDKEVVAVIENMFTGEDGQFNREHYVRFLKYRLSIAPRIFEEYFRQFIQIDKLFEKYAKVEITEEEVKDSYIKDTRKAKINYIFIESKTEEKTEAEQTCKELLAKIKEANITDLKEIVKGTGYELKETDFFKYYDSIESIEINAGVSEIIFNLNKDEIYSEPVIMPKGAYIIQLAEKTAFDEKDYIEKKQTHYDALLGHRSLMKRGQFLSDLEKEFNLEIYPPESTHSS